MTTARPLREIFQELATGSSELSQELPESDPAGSDPGELLRANGHADLPDGLVAEAVVNYADTAPIEVAEHLSPYVMANSPVPVPDGADEPDASSWLDALASAPVPAIADPASLDADAHGTLGLAPEGTATMGEAPGLDDAPEDVDDGFGHGGGGGEAHETFGYHGFGDSIGHGLTEATSALTDFTPGPDPADLDAAPHQSFGSAATESFGHAPDDGSEPDDDDDDTPDL